MVNQQHTIRPKESLNPTYGALGVGCGVFCLCLCQPWGGDPGVVVGLGTWELGAVPMLLLLSTPPSLYLAPSLHCRYSFQMEGSCATGSCASAASVSLQFSLPFPLPHPKDEAWTSGELLQSHPGTLGGGRGKEK